MTQYFPEGAELEKFIKRRRQKGVIWRSLFLLATTLGVVILMVLLITIIDDTMGYAAVQYKIDPQDLVVSFYKQIMLDAPNTVTSEDDDFLARQITQNPDAVGFMGHGAYQTHADGLRIVPIDGILPDAETVASGDYPLARPLFIITSQEALQARGATAAFVGYFLTHVTAEVGETGYFPAPEQALNEGMTAWQKATGLTPDTAAGNLTTTGQVAIAGSSTVMPITQRMAQGAGIDVKMTGGGTQAGVEALCQGRADIANASRPMTFSEQQRCQLNGITPMTFLIATDGITVVVNQDNDWVEGLSSIEAAKLFTIAAYWSDMASDWPARPIMRFIPGPQSGTLDVFVARIFGDDLAAQPTEALVAMLARHLSPGALRRLMNDQQLAAYSHEDFYQLVVERVLEPTIVQTWSLSQSIFQKDEIEEVVAQIPRAQLEFRRWVTWDFITSPQSSKPEFAGVRTAILGSLWVVFITLIFSVPVGIGAAIYLEEYGSGGRLDQFIENNINNLAGVPSIIYGMLGLAVFVRAMEPLTSGSLFGLADPTTANGRTILAAGLTLGLLILPIIIINAREAIRAVPRAFREASYGLGATKWQTIWYHVLPNAIPGILTGSILAISRAFGETAPLVVVGASTAIFMDPNGPFSKFTTLPIQIYQWTSRPQAAFQNLAAAAIIVLLTLLLALNAVAVILRNKYQRSY